MVIWTKHSRGRERARRIERVAAQVRKDCARFGEDLSSVSDADLARSASADEFAVRRECPPRGLCQYDRGPRRAATALLRWKPLGTVLKI